MNDFEPLEFTITELYKLPIHNNICNLWKCLPVSNTIINVKQYIVRGSIRNIFNNPDILILIDLKLQEYSKHTEVIISDDVWEMFEIVKQFPFIQINNVVQ